MNLCDKSNYCCVGLCSVLSKILEAIILKRIENCLCTSANQFGFKKNLSTEMCIFLLNKVVNIYRESITSIFIICFMDATKAFDSESLTGKFLHVWSGCCTFGIQNNLCVLNGAKRHQKILNVPMVYAREVFSHYIFLMYILSMSVLN